MSGKEKSLHYKVKQFFGIKESAPINFDSLKTEPYVISEETLKDISTENSLNHRLKVLKDLYEILLTKKLANYAIEAICKYTEDLLDQNSAETRHIILEFYSTLIQGQYEQLEIMRHRFFRLILKRNIPEVISPRLKMLKILCGNGRNIDYFEEEIGPFLFHWFPEIIANDKTTEFLPLITNIIRFNAAYLDDDIITGFINHISYLCGQTRNEEDIQGCLDILNAVLCYSHLPADALQQYIYSLCITVSIESFSECSWKLMRNLLGTNIGHASMFTLCCILQEMNNYDKISLVRGAVFFIGMAVWGPNKVVSLRYSPSAVLPSFYKVLVSNSSTIAYEVALSLQQLVKKSKELLTNFCWDVIFDVIEKLLLFPEFQSASQPMSSFAKAVHDLITAIEECCSEPSLVRLYKIVERCSASRSEESVIRLIAHQAECINPLQSDFIAVMNRLLEKYFKNDKRSAVQYEVLNVLRRTRRAIGHPFDDDLIDQCVLQYMSQLDAVSDFSVRKIGVEILIEIAESCTNVRLFFDMLDIIDKVMKRSFESLSDKNGQCLVLDRDAFSDILAAVQGLINLFKIKLYILPSSFCIRIYKILIRHVNLHYQQLCYLDEIVKVRKLIFTFLLQIRANHQKQIGIYHNGSVEYCVYISCDSGESNESSAASPSPGSPSFFSSEATSYLSYADAFATIIICLKQEKNWEILEIVLNDLPMILQNKALIVRGKCPIATLCVTLRVMVNDRNYGFPDALKNAPQALTRTEIHTRIFPSVAALTSYHLLMEMRIQSQLIRCLQCGLVSRSAKICMEGLTLCTLEMQNSMVKLLPDVLLKLSKISATVGVAVSVLEFLSNLIRLPHLYESFVEDQYMSIFAIALPYTNPSKFNQYTVALAHHVIAMWFLKCRIPFRKDFAKFITKGLRNNITIPCDGSKQVTDKQNVNKAINESMQPESSLEAINTLHTELMETGLDLMARFTFGMSSNVPKRCPVAEFLLEKGQRASWLVGNKVITITTSGCGTRSFKFGLCERCYSSCRDITKSTESDGSESNLTESDISVDAEREADPVMSERKRHRSEFQPRNMVSSKTMLSEHQSKDDMLLHFHSFGPQESTARRHTYYSPQRSSGPLFATNKMESSVQAKEKEDKSHLCSCWCSGWAEVHIRRPTGNTSWMMKIQNHLFLPSSPPDIPLSVLSSLVLPQKEPEHDDNNECFLLNDESECPNPMDVEMKGDSCEGAIDIETCQKPNSMRRTNSSPDMNTSWSDYKALNAQEQKCLDDPIECDKEALQFGPKVDQDSAFSSMLPDTCDTKPNLKLDLSACKSSTKSSRTLSFAQDPISSAPIETLLQKEAQHSSAASSSFRDRGHTISVMSPIHPQGLDKSGVKTEVSRRSGMNPSFVFLQLFHNSCFGPVTHKPLQLLQTETNNRALGVLDHIPPYDTHKIGVVYVGPDQVDDEVAILSNVYGSARYIAFLQGLGKFVKLTDVDPHTTYLGGLDTRGEDGKFGLIWHDDVMQVVFHVATMMHNKESDPMRNEKKKHIANNFVVIVYNESGQDYNLSTIRGHVTTACVVIQPEDFNGNVVTVKLKTKELVDTFGHSEAYIVSDDSLPVFVRQMALHANLASLILSLTQQSAKYSHVSNWLERLRTIKRLCSKVEELKRKNENLGFENNSNESAYFDDFTDYV